MKVTIMRGIPGSGKSTWAATNYPNATVVSADHYFMVGGKYIYDQSKIDEAHAECMRKFIGYMLSRTDHVVVDNTNTTHVAIAPYAAVAAAYGADVEVVTVLADVKLAAARNVHSVPLDAISRMAANIERTQKSIPKWWNPRIVNG